MTSPNMGVSQVFRDMFIMYPNTHLFQLEHWCVLTKFHSALYWTLLYHLKSIVYSCFCKPFNQINLYFTINNYYCNLFSHQNSLQCKNQIWPKWLQLMSILFLKSSVLWTLFMNCIFSALCSTVKNDRESWEQSKTEYRVCSIFENSLWKGQLSFSVNVL